MDQLLDVDTRWCYPPSTMADTFENIGTFIRERREARGWSQADLAEKAGTSQQNIGRIEAGTVRHSRYIQPILAILGSDMGRALSSLPPDQPIARNALVGDRDFPIYSSAEGGEGAMVVIFDPVDFMLRPAPMMHVREGYGVIVSEESMVPEYRPGDIALVNPRIPVRRDKSAIFMTPEGQSVKALIKVFDGSADSGPKGEWRVRQWNPPLSFTLSKKDWPRCYALVGRYDAR